MNVESTVQCTVKNEIRSFSHIKAKNLKQSALYRTVYISPGERETHKKLMIQLESNWNCEAVIGSTIILSEMVNKCFVYQKVIRKRKCVCVCV